MYDGLATVSDNFALVAHTELKKSWDAPESNRMIAWRPDIKKVPISTSPLGISLTVVRLTRPLLSIGAISCPLR
jgi:hypothetical protein